MHRHPSDRSVLCSPCARSPSSGTVYFLSSLPRSVSRQLMPPSLEKSTRDMPSSPSTRRRGIVSDEVRFRSSGPLLADSVAKDPKCLATNFSQRDETSDNRRSMCPHPLSTATPSKFTAPAFAYSESMRPNPISFAMTRVVTNTAAGRKHRMHCSTSLIVAPSNASR